MATWKEFKEAVEKAGVKDTDIIAWIDVGSLPTQLLHLLDVSRNKDGEIEISE
jgi:hypothetical protein